MSTHAPSLSVVIPMYNEQDNVAPMLQRVHEALGAYGGPWELICIDDGSRDDTSRRLQDGAKHYGAHVRLLRFARNHGQTAAMQAGLDAARGELIATLDGDLQNDPGDIPRMVQELLERDLDLLAGRRANRQDDYLSRKLPSRIANRLIAQVTGVHLHDYGCSLKLYRSTIIKQVRLYGEMHRLIPVWAAMVTSPSRIAETDVQHHPRVHGVSKYGISRTFRVMLDLLTVFFFLRYQARPGHFFGSIGLVLGAIGGSMFTYLVFVKFAFGQDIGGRPMLLVSVLLLMFALQLITTGVLAEMLSRLFFHDSTHKPITYSNFSGADQGWLEPRIPVGLQQPPRPTIFVDPQSTPAQSPQAESTQP